MSLGSKRPESPRRLLAILAVTQIVSWGSLYYAFSVLLSAIQADLGLPTGVVLASFTLSLLVSGAVTPLFGWLIDRWGGAWVMAFGSLTSGLGCVLLGFAESPLVLFLGWTLVGIGMAGTLYDAAFATIVQVDSSEARRTISYLTFFGGLASTVFWPLSAWLLGAVGWQGAYLSFAVLHLAVCLPLHLWLPRRSAGIHQQDRSPTPQVLSETLRMPVFWFLAAAFSLNSFLFSALAIQMIPLFQTLSHPMELILWVSALVGPMQVLGRVLELSFGLRFPIRHVGVLCFAVLPAAFLLLGIGGTQPFVLLLFCCLYGISNGLMTIVRGVVIKEQFDSAHYGLVAGLVSGLSVAFRAGGPFLIGMTLQGPNGAALAISLLGLISMISLGFFALAARKETMKDIVD